MTMRRMPTWDHKEYWIFCDESVQEGAKFSNFFGGVIIPAVSHANVENHLRGLKADIGFLHELKWQRVSEQWLEGYKAMMTGYFELLRKGFIRMRLMFRDNQAIPEGLNRTQRDEGYFKLYYQFIKHAFGLNYIPLREDGTRFRLHFDQFPHTKENVLQFKGFLGALPAILDDSRVLVSPDHITEIDSKEHVLLQCVDLVLGSMAWRLNDGHKLKPEGQRTRGKRTIAKDRLYRHILSEIRSLKPFLNPKISTATEPYPSGRWTMPYRHWSFTPRP